jgi:hypothetical protein
MRIPPKMIMIRNKNVNVNVNDNGAIDAGAARKSPPSEGATTLPTTLHVLWQSTDPREFFKSQDTIVVLRPLILTPSNGRVIHTWESGVSSYILLDDLSWFQVDFSSETIVLGTDAPWPADWKWMPAPKEG